MVLPDWTPSLLGPLHVPTLIRQSAPCPVRYLLDVFMSHKLAMTLCQTPQVSPYVHLSLCLWCSEGGEGLAHSFTPCGALLVPGQASLSQVFLMTAS